MSASCLGFVGGLLVGVREAYLTSGSSCCVEDDSSCWALKISIPTLMQVRRL